ncbi:MAG TPA: hypothetical protein PLA80_12590 [Synergistaceae bacterium]|nr:hypothetical protein [Synergistaceae bacterium]
MGYFLAILFLGLGFIFPPLFIAGLVVLAGAFIRDLGKGVRSAAKKLASNANRDNNHTVIVRGNDHNKCPHCSGYLLPSAEKCPHCGKDVERQKPKVVGIRDCPFCFGEIPEDAKKCKHCGEWVVPVCANCGTPAGNQGQKACTKCGKAL